MISNLEFCVSLTTIPPRFISIKKTIDSLNLQTQKPDKIFLNIPTKFRRFSQIKYDFSKLKEIYDNLEIVDCEDFGPGTKILGSIKKIMDYKFVVLVDDDHVYDKNMLRLFHDHAKKNLDKAYSFCVYNVEDCLIGQGADGFMINTIFLKNMLKFYKNNIEANDKLFLNDDLWISIYINKILKKDISNIFSSYKSGFFFKKKSIYKKHTQKGAIIETYSSNRKVARDLKFIENCKEYTKLKNKTKNFTII